VQAVVSESRRNFGQPFFMEVVIMAIWNIWLIRNGEIFDRDKPMFARWKCKFVHDMYNLQYRIKARYKDKLIAWLDGLP
jgi:hypothetical protein